MKHFLILLLSLNFLSFRASEIEDLLTQKHLSVRFCVNHYDNDLYNKLINSYVVNAEIKNTNEQQLKTQKAEWIVRSQFKAAGNGIIDADFTFKLVKGYEKESAVAVEIKVSDWTRENFVLMPAAAYNGNRFESRKIPYSPKLNDYRDIGYDKPIIISDVPRLNIHEGPSFIQERSGGMTLPCVGYHSPKSQQGVLIITKQNNAWGDYGINVEETRNTQNQSAFISILSPLVRERHKYEIANNSAASPDMPANFEQGDEVKFSLRIRFFESPNIQSVFDQFLAARHDLASTPTVPYIYPFSECYKTIEQKFNTLNFIPEWGYYAIGMRENFLQDWQIGWTGGMITTYPLLFSKDEKTIQHVVANFNWLFSNGISPSGFFWDSGEKGNKWYGGDIRRPQFKNLHLIRKSGDALYYIIKQLELMKLRNVPIKPEWEQGTLGVANAFVKLWDKWRQFGNFVDSTTGDVVVGGSTSGAIVPAGLILASDYFKNPQFQKIAELSAQKMYDDYVSKGITCGGPGDAMQNPDSESAYAMLESFALLYEKSRNEKWLRYAREMAAQFSTWVMSYDYEYPDNCLFGKLNMKTTGVVFANTQNKHGSPGICTHSGLALLRLYRATNNPAYLTLLQEITQAIPQYMSHSTRSIAGMPAGWINERVSTTDWFEGIGEIKAGSTWAETAMLLTTTELPSIYVDTELKNCYTFDHLKAEIVKKGAKKVQLKVTNPTKFDADFKVIVENKKLKAISWKENKILEAKNYTLKAGETKMMNLVGL